MQAKVFVFVAVALAVLGDVAVPRTAAQAPAFMPSSVPAEPIERPGAKKRAAAAETATNPAPTKPTKKRKAVGAVDEVLASDPPAPKAAAKAPKVKPAAATDGAAVAPAPKVKPKAAAAEAPADVATPKGKVKLAAAPAKSKGKAKRRERQPTPAYLKLRESWHAPTSAPLTPTLPVTGRVPLVLSQVNGGEIVTLVPQRDDGGFTDVDLQRASEVFAPKDVSYRHPIAPRLLDLVYRAMRHFNAPMVHIVSGYRKDRAGSRHTQGRAIDMVLPGVTNDDLAEYVRRFGFCGVGIYPKSGFVHLDVRDKSYFWLDNSLPGERSRTTPMMAPEAMSADRAAAARGEAPDYFVPDNDEEDRAAAKAYARRAKQRRDRATRKLARETQAKNDTPNDSSRAKSKAPAQGGYEAANVFGGLPP